MLHQPTSKYLYTFYFLFSYPVFLNRNTNPSSLTCYLSFLIFFLSHFSIQLIYPTPPCLRTISPFVVDISPIISNPSNVDTVNFLLYMQLQSSTHIASRCSAFKRSLKPMISKFPSKINETLGRYPRHHHNMTKGHYLSLSIRSLSLSLLQTLVILSKTPQKQLIVDKTYAIQGYIIFVLSIVRLLLVSKFSPTYYSLQIKLHYSPMIYLCFIPCTFPLLDSLLCTIS